MKAENHNIVDWFRRNHILIESRQKTTDSSYNIYGSANVTLIKPIKLPLKDGSHILGAVPDKPFYFTPDGYFDFYVSTIFNMKQRKFLFDDFGLMGKLQMKQIVHVFFQAEKPVPKPSRKFEGLTNVKMSTVHYEHFLTEEHFDFLKAFTYDQTVKRVKHMFTEHMQEIVTSEEVNEL